MGDFGIQKRAVVRWNYQFGIADWKKNKKGGMYMSKLNVNDLATMIANMSDDERNALGLALKENEVKITARKEKKEPIILGYRVSLKDWGGKNPRKAGDKEPIFERTLTNLLNTWVRGKDALVKKNNYRHDFLTGKELLVLSTNFKLVPADNIADIVREHNISLVME